MDAGYTARAYRTLFYERSYEPFHPAYTRKPKSNPRPGVYIHGGYIHTTESLNKI